MGKGVQLVIDEWLPLMDQKVLDSSRVVETVVPRLKQEAAWAVDVNNSGPLRYVSGREDKDKGLVLNSTLGSSLENIKSFLNEAAPISWSILKTTHAKIHRLRSATDLELGIASQ